MKTKSLPPYAPTLIESTRAIGYSLEAAVADIIDNSIAANAKNVDIYFFPIDGAYIAILDNGKGMTEKEIDIAMQYGSKNPTEERDKKDLGRFGLGLKTASLSQCRCLTVISKQGDNLEGRQWDIDHVTEVGDWSLNVLDEEDIQQIPQFDELIKNESGTLVVWQKLDRLKSGEINFELSLGRKIDRVRDHLSLVYHRYLAGESGITKLKLSINGEKIKGIDPFLTEKSVQAILNNPQMFFAFNNGISATAMDVEIEDTNHGRFITFVRDFQIINGGQTTASISNARYKDKADLSSIFVQMKLTSIDESTPEESDELIRNISRSSNSQNKVSDADFFASHPFHRRMEQISRHLFAPASEGAQYETKWFYERARGQYLQEQMRLTPAKKKQFELQHPKNKVIKKTDLAKVQNTWRGFPQIVSKGAQTNFNSFAEYIDEQWNTNEEQFNERYFQTTAALILLFQYLEKTIPKQPWYEGGYRANIIYYTLAQFRRLLHSQYQGQELDLMLIWNRQSVPEQVGTVLIALAERVLLRITDPSRKVANVTQWCKRNDCWEDVKKIHIDIPEDIENYLITIDEQKDAQKSAKKEQKVVNEIQAQTTVVNYPVEMWMRLSEFVVRNHMVTPTDVSALAIACKMPAKIPNTYQCKRLLALLRKASEEGFNIEA